MSAIEKDRKEVFTSASVAKQKLGSREIMGIPVTPLKSERWVSRNIHPEYFPLAEQRT
jgi:hypothetical protein